MSTVAKIELVLLNKLGLHARAATQLVKCAMEFQSQIFLEYKTEVVDAKSILDLLTLGMGVGASFIIQCDGPDANEAQQALQKLIENKFGEKE